MTPLLGWTLLGVPLSTLAPWAAGLAIATTALYLLRLRRRTIVVPFLQLWDRELGERSAEELRTRLRRLLSLLLQLLLLALLLLALLDPRPDAHAEPEQSLVVLVDTSASMGAPWTNPSLQAGEEAAAMAQETSTRLGAIVPELRRVLEERGPRDEVLLVDVGGQPAPLGPWTRSSSDLERQLAELSPRGGGADLRAALRVASEALASRKRGRVLFVSDGAFPEDELRALETSLPSEVTVEFLPVFRQKEEARDNIGISALSARRYPLDPRRFEVLLELANTGKSHAEVEVLFYRPDDTWHAGQLIEARRLNVPSGDRIALVITDLSSIEEGIICRVSRVDGGDNWLTADDTAYARLKRRAKARVLLVGEENTFLDAALLANPGITTRRITPASYPPQGDYDVVLFDGVFPARHKKTGAAIYLGLDSATPTDHVPLATGRTLSMFGFDTWDKKSEVFRYIDPYDVQVLEGKELEPRPGDQVLGRSAGRPIAVLGNRPEGPFLALGFDPRRSDFVLRAAFPLFIDNALQSLSPAPVGEEGQSLRVGKITEVKASGDTLTLEGPLGAPERATLTLPVLSGRASLRPEHAGFHVLSDDRGRRLLSANYFDEQEATLAPRAELPKKEGVRPVAVIPRRPPTSKSNLSLTSLMNDFSLEPWMALLLFFCAASALEWWSYHRRFTV